MFKESKILYFSNSTKSFHELSTYKIYEMLLVIKNQVCFKFSDLSFILSIKGNSLWHLQTMENKQVSLAFERKTSKEIKAELVDVQVTYAPAFKTLYNRMKEYKIVRRP